MISDKEMRKVFKGFDKIVPDQSFVDSTHARVGSYLQKNTGDDYVTIGSEDTTENSGKNIHTRTYRYAAVIAFIFVLSSVLILAVFRDNIADLFNNLISTTEPANTPDKREDLFKDKYTKLTYDSQVIDLSFDVKDAAEKPDAPVFFFISENDYALYEVNYITGSKRKVNFGLVPDKLVHRSNKLYVTLLSETGPNAVAVINADSMTVEKRFDLDYAPCSIAVDREGYVYISSGSGNDYFVYIYNGDFDFVKKVKMPDNIYMQYNEVTNCLYWLEGIGTADNYRSYIVNNGEFQKNADRTKLNAAADTQFRISPDGNYLFDRLGIILTCSESYSSNLKFKDKLKYKFGDIAFDLKRDTFYTSHGHQVLMYNYSNYDIQGYYNTYGEISYMFFKDDNLVTVGVDGNNRSYIEIVKTEKEPLDVERELFYIERDLIMINFEFSDVVKHPGKNVYYFTSQKEKALFEYNYDTNTVREIRFNMMPDQLTFKDNRIYVTLMKKMHDPYIQEADQEGAYAVINADTMEVEDLVDIYQDPYDIAVDNNGSIYITPGSGQWAKLIKYTPTSFAERTVMAFQGDRILYNPFTDRVYTMFKTQFSGTIKAYSPEMEGLPIEISDENYNSCIDISPDGKYLFNGSGDVFKSSENRRDDLFRYRKLKNKFTCIAFSQDDIYTSFGSKVSVYDYATFEFKYELEFGNEIHSLFYYNKILYGITKNKGSGMYQIEQLILINM